MSSVDASPRRTLLHAFATFDLGGPQARFVALANAFGDRYRHLIVAMDRRYGAADRLSPGIDWRSVDVPIIKGTGLANRATFRRALNDLRPDMLITYNWGAIEWVAANLPRRVRNVHVEEGFERAEASRQFTRRKWLRRVLLNATRTPVIVASAALAEIARATWKLPPERIAHLRNGVDTTRFGAAAGSARSAARARYNLPLDARVVGTLAGLRPEKNIARLLRAFARLDAPVDSAEPLYLLLLGDGAQRGELERLAEHLGVGPRVRFAGMVTDPADALPALDLFALSSDTEQLPIALLEAMACHLPVVATRVGDVADVAGSGNWLSAPDDDDFARALALALTQSQGWAQVGQGNRECVEQRFSWRSTCRHWQAVYDGGPVSDA